MNPIIYAQFRLSEKFIEFNANSAKRHLEEIDLCIEKIYKQVQQRAKLNTQLGWCVSLVGVTTACITFGSEFIRLPDLVKKVLQNSAQFLPQLVSLPQKYIESKMMPLQTDEAIGTQHLSRKLDQQKNEQEVLKELQRQIQNLSQIMHEAKSKAANSAQ